MNISTLAALTFALAITRSAHAEDVETMNGVVAGTVTDDARGGIDGASVRIVGEAFVLTVHADLGGWFRVAGLPAGHYRLEADRGTVHHAIPGIVTRISDDHLGWCVVPIPERVRVDELRPLCGSRMRPRRTFASAGPLGHVETTSTAQGIRLGPHQLLGR